MDIHFSTLKNKQSEFQMILSFRQVRVKVHESHRQVVIGKRFQKQNARSLMLSFALTGKRPKSAPLFRSDRPLKPR